MLQGLLWRCMCVCACVRMFVCVCVFSVKPASPLYLKSLARHAGGLKRCSRDCSGVLVVASLEETQGLLSRFDSVYLGYITQGVPAGALVVAMSLPPRCFFIHTHPLGQLAEAPCRNNNVVDAATREGCPQPSAVTQRRM